MLTIKNYVDLTIFYEAIVVNLVELYERFSFWILQFRVLKIKHTITECKKSEQKISVKKIYDQRLRLLYNNIMKSCLFVVNPSPTRRRWSFAPSRLHASNRCAQRFVKHTLPRDTLVHVIVFSWCRYTIYKLLSADPIRSHWKTPLSCGRFHCQSVVFSF